MVAGPESSVSAEVVAALDGNTTANEIYKHNMNRFHMTNVHSGLSLTDPVTMEIFLMECPMLGKCPRFILLRNVKGFKTSAARDALVKTLRECIYSFQEFLISPTSLGIPNSKLRYFLIAKRPPESFLFHSSIGIIEGFPKSTFSETSDNSALPNNDPSPTESQREKTGTIIFKLETEQELERKRNQDRQETVQRLQDFLQDEKENMDQYLLPPKSLLRYALLIDIVQPSNRRSGCFTKWCVTYSSITYCAIMESFPKHISVNQQYRELGNSLNVHVVSNLFQLMMVTTVVNHMTGKKGTSAMTRSIIPSCTCPPGYVANGYGPTGCTQISDICGTSKPCVNGQCENTATGYICRCDPGWAGQNCDQNVKECSSNPCQNRGTCTDGINGYTCTCPSQWTGPQCQTPQHECGGVLECPAGTFSTPIILELVTMITKLAVPGLSELTLARSMMVKAPQPM
ncbi:tRNA (cytosine(38)-C(5))-methyltransferase-like [Myxocyprinus asiaticus]|uniref:tRNA (cytosine(38)-C(5))-methyltransferase-like n=1 Tax=Myxocyprinus asiaticus TaxID=70543 RepID=UPI002223DEB7|nr:tRNA (cytosine(38)-C(5))-methyltransferase-like [Myxocyprinus asiaticus]